MARVGDVLFSPRLMIQTKKNAQSWDRAFLAAIA